MNDSNDIDFRSLLNSYIDESGLHLSIIGDRAGVSASYISQLRSGKRKAPPIGCVTAICVALDLDDESEKIEHLRTAAAIERGEEYNHLEFKNIPQRYSAKKNFPDATQSQVQTSCLWGTLSGSVNIEIQDKKVRINVDYSKACRDGIVFIFSIFQEGKSRPYCVAEIPDNPGIHESSLKAGKNHLRLVWIDEKDSNSGEQNPKDVLETWVRV